MSATLEEFRAKFRIAELTLYQSSHWTWSLRPSPATLGAGILSLNRFCTSFAELSADEGADLAAIVKHIDARLQKVFAPDRMNYLMLMMVDRQLHFHVLPRYSTEREAGGLFWSDSDWPKPPTLSAYSERSNHPALLEIRNLLRSRGGSTSRD